MPITCANFLGRFLQPYLNQQADPAKISTGFISRIEKNVGIVVSGGTSDLSPLLTEDDLDILDEADDLESLAESPSAPKLSSVSTSKKEQPSSSLLLTSEGTQIQPFSPLARAYLCGENPGLLTLNLPHMISMVPTPSTGPSSTSFLINTNKAKHLNGKAVVFGRVVEGFETLKDVEKGFTMRGRLAVGVKIGAGGVHSKK
jgi:cyclophilin family peptidyl-prolyl cis-trans isomerase